MGINCCIGFPSFPLSKNPKGCFFFFFWREKMMFISSSRVSFYVFWLYSYFPQLFLDSHLFPSYPTWYTFLFLNPLRQICTTQIFLDVWSCTREWSTYQWLPTYIHIENFLLPSCWQLPITPWFGVGMCAQCLSPCWDLFWLRFAQDGYKLSQLLLFFRGFIVASFTGGNAF